MDTTWNSGACNWFIGRLKDEYGELQHKKRERWFLFLMETIPLWLGMVLLVGNVLLAGLLYIPDHIAVWISVAISIPGIVALRRPRFLQIAQRNKDETRSTLATYAKELCASDDLFWEWHRQCLMRFSFGLRRIHRTLQVSFIGYRNKL